MSGTFFYKTNLNSIVDDSFGKQVLDFTDRFQRDHKKNGKLRTMNALIHDLVLVWYHKLWEYKRLLWRINNTMKPLWVISYGHRMKTLELTFHWALFHRWLKAYDVLIHNNYSVVLSEKTIIYGVLETIDQDIDQD